MECVSCNGAGCLDCDEQGSIIIAACPLEFVTADVWEVIKFAELYEKGLPPVAGGALDQACIFINAAMFIFREKAHWKAKLGIL